MTIAEHRAAMVAKFGPLAGDVYDYAYEQGHSSGYSEVENHLLDLVDLAKVVADSRTAEIVALLDKMRQDMEPQDECYTVGWVKDEIARHFLHTPTDAWEYQDARRKILYGLNMPINVDEPPVEENPPTWTEAIDRLLPDNGDPERQHLMWAMGSLIAVFAGKGYTNRQIMAACALHFAVAYEAEGWGECDQYTIYRALGLDGDIDGPINTRPAAEADPRMAAIAYGQSDEHRERFLREKQPPSPAAKVCEWEEFPEGYGTACGDFAFVYDPTKPCDCGLPVNIKPAKAGEDTKA